MKILVVFPSALLLRLHLANHSNRPDVTGIDQINNIIHFAGGTSHKLVRIGIDSKALAGQEFHELRICKGVDPALAKKKFGHRIWELKNAKPR